MNLVKYFKESLAELHKVTWPTRSQAVKSTIIVLIFTLVVGALIAVVDWGFTEGLKQIMLRFF